MNTEELKLIYEEYKVKKPLYDKMYEYYKGNTDAKRNYKMITNRSDNKADVNFMKKFIKEEVSYAVGNDVTFASKTGNKDVIKEIDYNISNLNTKHNMDLTKYMLIHGIAFEIAYINKKGEFDLKIIKATEGYYYNDNGNEVFLHIYRKKLDKDNTYIDVYTEDCIYHVNDKFETVATLTPHFFEQVPVSLAKLSDELENDTIYSDIKGLQDAYFTNLSDGSNEISDTRDAYLIFKNVQMDDEDIDKIKERCVMALSGDKASAEWLIKNLNPAFYQLILETIEDKIYQMSGHINHNEKLQSNLSGIALRSRLISLENKCTDIEKALSNCIKKRLQLLFKYLEVVENKKYDWRDIEIKFTPNVPSDDLMIAQIVSQTNDLFSKETKRSLFSFCSNTDTEEERIKKEQENDVNTIGKQLLDNVGVADEQAEN